MPSPGSGSTRWTPRPPATRGASTPRSSTGRRSSTRSGRSSTPRSPSEALPDRHRPRPGRDRKVPARAGAGVGARGRRGRRHRTLPPVRKRHHVLAPRSSSSPTSAGSSRCDRRSRRDRRRRGRPRPPSSRDECHRYRGAEHRGVLGGAAAPRAALGAAPAARRASRTCTGPSRRCSTSSSTSQRSPPGPLVLLCIARPELLESRPGLAAPPRSSSWSSSRTTRLPSSSRRSASRTRIS